MAQTLTNTQQVGHLLSANRKAQGLTQAQAAARLGISQARFSELEQNPGRLTVERLLVLANLLGLELVGQWTLKRNGAHELVYADSWNRSVAARPLSLSLPMAGQHIAWAKVMKRVSGFHWQAHKRKLV